MSIWYNCSESPTGIEEKYISIYDAKMDTIPAGPFIFGDINRNLSIDYDFGIMRYEVTNAQFAEYLNEVLKQGEITVNDTSVLGYYEGDPKWDLGNYEYFNLNGQGCRIYFRNETFKVVNGYKNHPVTHVSWFGAQAFATHYEMRLPTNEEWEKAARGNSDRIYPWGNSIDGSWANYIDSSDPYDNGTTPVGYFNGENHNGFQTNDGRSPYGCYDMAGNVWEWMGDLAGTSAYYPIRGGSWDSSLYFLKSYYYSLHFPWESTSIFGFRLAKTLSSL